MKSICWIYDLFSASLLGKIFSTHPGEPGKHSLWFTSAIFMLYPSHIFWGVSQRQDTTCLPSSWKPSWGLFSLPLTFFPPAHLYTWWSLSQAYRSGLALELVSQGVLAVVILWGTATSDPLLAVSRIFLLFFSQDLGRCHLANIRNQGHVSQLLELATSPLDDFPSPVSVGLLGSARVMGRHLHGWGGTHWSSSAHGDKRTPVLGHLWQHFKIHRHLPQRDQPMQSEGSSCPVNGGTGAGRGPPAPPGANTLKAWAGVCWALSPWGGRGWWGVPPTAPEVPAQQSLTVVTGTATGSGFCPPHPPSCEDEPRWAPGPASSSSFVSWQRQLHLLWGQVCVGSSFSQETPTAMNTGRRHAHSFV